MSGTPPRLGTRFVTVLVAASLGSCGDEAGPAGWEVTTDTVDGVVRVENAPPESGPRPTLVAAEELRVGTVAGGGPASFGMIRSIAVLPDGRFAVADAQAEEVRLFDGQGRHLRTFGGKGAGPGELQGMQGVYVDHEGLLRVAEQGNARLSVFHPDTGLVTTYPLRLHSYGFRGPWPAAVDSAGRTLVASSGQYGEGRYWNMVRVYDPTMHQIDSIPYREYTDVARRATGGGSDDDFPGAWRIDLGNGGWTWAQVPFYAQPYEVLAPTGEFWSSAEGRRELEIARWMPPGDTSLVLTSRRPPDPVTPAERDSAMTELRETLARRSPSPPSLDASRVPATKPPLHGLSLDRAGRLWVRLTEPTADSTVYDVFGRDGRHAETVRLPFRVDRYVPPLVRGDVLWAVVTDDMDVQYVVRAALRSPSRDTGP
ncbi:MAG TPA: hypothetical protein VE646_12865 [Actinomycetota bacterium]|nr:hypothetical protein [Actinomycetota bacterium]